MVESEVIKLTPSLVAGLRQCGHQIVWLRTRPEQRRAFTETGPSARGRSVHAALAEFHATGGARAHAREALLGMLGRFWVRDGYPDAEEERVSRLRSEAELDAYYDAFGRDGGTLATERSSSLLRDLDGLRTEWFGRMDWIRRDGDALEVVDWKTCSRRVTAEALAADPVTVMYGRLARTLAQQETGWEGGPVRFSLLFLDRMEKVTVALTREMVRAAEAELARLAHGLNDGRLPAAEGPWCAWHGGCPVRLAGECPLLRPPVLEGEW